MHKKMYFVFLFHFFSKIIQANTTEVSTLFNSYFRYEECATTDAIRICDKNCNSFQPSCKNSSNCASGNACCKASCSPLNCYSCTGTLCQQIQLIFYVFVFQQNVRFKIYHFALQGLFVTLVCMEDVGIVNAYQIHAVLIRVA